MDHQASKELESSAVEASIAISKTSVIEALQKVHDPEIPVNIYALGLIYDIVLNESIGGVIITMTFTSPSCPAADMILEDVYREVQAVNGVKEVEVNITFSPPYSPDMMSEAAKLELGFM